MSRKRPREVTLNGDGDHEVVTTNGKEQTTEFETVDLVNGSASGSGIEYSPPQVSEMF